MPLNRFGLLIVPLLLVAALSGCLGGDEDPSQVDEAEGGSEQEQAADEQAAGNETTQTPSAPADDQTAPPTIEITIEHTGFYLANAGYQASTDQVPAGATLIVTYRNTDMNPLGRHDWFFEGIPDSKTEVIAQGEEQTVTFTAPQEPGEYFYWCTIEGHRERGLEGTMTVTAS